MTNSREKRKKLHRKFEQYSDYVEKVVKKCGHATVIMDRKDFREYRLDKFNKVPGLKLPGGKLIKLVPARCNSYSCPICGARKVFDLMERLKGVDLRGYRFFTLTLKNKKTFEDTEKNINRIAECFNKLNKTLRKDPQYSNLEYFRVLEVGSDGMVHIHGIWNKYIPWGKLSDMWLQITGDSKVVRPERVKSKKDAVQYLFKYLTKNIADRDSTSSRTLFNIDVLNTASLFYENGKRRYQSSRKFFPVKQEKRKSDYLPYYHEETSDKDIENTIKHLKSEFGLKREHFDLESYPFFTFLEYIFNDST